ncbi:MAG: phenylalanine--tRNA ligase subunit beta [Chthoniobacterales bacterium]
MKIALSWLQGYVVLPDSAEALADALTSGGTEVIGRETRGSIPDKIVVAQILTSEPHPNADRLSVCSVDDGSGTPRQIVCGAKNYRVGDKVPLALPGAVLGPDFKIKAGKLRGVTSEGMMCSAKELALADDAEGLLILPAEAAVGRAVKELFPPETILELEVTPNRPDLLGYHGVAREVAALTGGGITANPTFVGSEKAAGDFVRLEDPAGPFYTARLIRGVRVAPSPAWLADRLSAVGLRPINNVVDVTNYVLLETGQPLHAFDLSKLSGRLAVRAAAEGETLEALDGSKLVLRAHDLVIADEAKAVALAGVMGGAETGVTATTTDLLLESAWFEPSRVRRTSRELGLQTDSSYRFERRVDPAGVISASARAVELILLLAGGTADAEILTAGSPPVLEPEVAMDNGRCRALLGLDIADDEIAAILTRLGLTNLGAGSWRVPSFRPDLTREVDLCEEVIRIAGIERVPSRLRGFPAATSRGDLRHDRAEILRARLRAQGFGEARTSHFVSPEVLAKAGAVEADALRIRNPLGADQALLRPVLLAGLLEALGRNLRHGAGGVRLFELGRIFSARGEERTALGLITTGAIAPASWPTAEGEADLYDLKGVLLAALGSLDFTVPSEGGAALHIEGPVVVGTLRRLPRALAETHDARGAIHYAEVVLDGWLETPTAPVRVRALPKYPAVERDLSAVLPDTTVFAALEKSLRAAQAPHLESVSLKDVFTDPSGQKLAVGQRSFTVTLTFRDATRTLTSDEVDRAVETLRAHAKAELGAVFRA